MGSLVASLATVAVMEHFKKLLLLNGFWSVARTPTPTPDQYD